MKLMLLIALAMLLLTTSLWAGAEDKVYQTYLPDMGQGQKARLFIPDGVKTVKGIIVDLGNPHGSDRLDYQAFARAYDYAVLGTLLRWPANLKENIDQIIADYAKQLNRPELNTAPWIIEGFSRSVGPGGTLALKYPDKVLAVMAGGISYGVKPEEIPAAKRVPTINIIGSNDAFAAGPEAVATLGWFHKNQTLYRDNHLPWGAGITWGAGHWPAQSMVLNAAFIKDVQAIRLPKDWDPAVGAPKMADMNGEETGYLGDIASWETQYPTIVPFKDFTGDKLTAHWLPGAYSAAVWRAYVVKTPDVSLLAPADATGEYSTKSATKPTKVEYYDGDQLIATGETLAAAKLTGLQCLYAVATIDGQPHITRPLLTFNGISITLGNETTAPSQEPINLLQLTPAQLTTATALLTRMNYAGETTWKVAFKDDFNGNMGVWKIGSMPGKTEIVDGTLQLTSNNQVLCALPYNWPRDIALEYRCRTATAGDIKPDDMGVMINGLDGGDRPWRDGLMFHFGADNGKRTGWQVVGESDAHQGVIPTAGKWAKVQIICEGNVLKASIDGVPLPDRTISSSELASIKGQRIGFYTYNSCVQFDDVNIYVKVPVDPADVQPAIPADKDLKELATVLVTLTTNQYAEQRYLSAVLIGKFSTELGPTLAALDPATVPTAAQAYLANIVKAIPPK